MTYEQWRKTAGGQMAVSYMGSHRRVLQEAAMALAFNGGFSAGLEAGRQITLKAIDRVFDELGTVSHEAPSTPTT